MLTPYDAVQLLERRIAEAISADSARVQLSCKEANDVAECIRRLVEASVYAPPPPPRRPT